MDLLQLENQTVIIMINVLLLTNKIDESPAGGRELLCKMNRDALKDIYGDRCMVFELAKSQIRSFKSILHAFRGHIDGLSAESIAGLIQQVQAKGVDKVFVDGSNLGELVRIIKSRFPEIRVCTFFHNVEARFFLGALKQTKTPHALAVLMVNYLAERKAVRYSDKIISLSERDSGLLQRLYGRPATDVSPMALQDKFPTANVSSANESRDKFALFVGGAFYANRVGITWFVKHVVPRIDIKTCVVGRGFEDFKNELEFNGKVEVIGEVESLAQWYLDSHFVIAPIFDGSGMKTKVAEALMFGKKIIGTPEAFSGYEEIADRAGRVCLSADDFVAAIDSADKIINASCDAELRTIFKARYSYEAAKSRLESIMMVMDDGRVSV